MNVERFDAGEPIQLSVLDGTWRLQYTSAPDVVVLFQSAATLPFFEVPNFVDLDPDFVLVLYMTCLVSQVDQIYQKFECEDQSGEGVVRNIVRWSIPRLLEVLLFILFCSSLFLENGI